MRVTGIRVRFVLSENGSVQGHLGASRATCGIASSAIRKPTQVRSVGIKICGDRRGSIEGSYHLDDVLER